MSQSLVKIYLHVIFCTKRRDPSLIADVCTELYPYMATVLQGLDCPALLVGGHTDHVHLLCCLSKILDTSKMIEKVKSSTSAWIKRKGNRWRNFYWQSGYGAFSVSPTNVERVKRYISNQKEHHRKETFEDEFRRFLRRYKVDYDERYVWI
ncbi:MAG: IS200/IS605 family transposase [bacterium]|nr:IS200/IS605 family transposase [bacterium]